MPKESIQKKLGRVRPPRVHIKYEVETGGAIEEKEIPFVIGVMADLSGQPEKPLPEIEKRKFVQIDRDNFNQALASSNPRLTCKVDNTLTDDDTRLGVELHFRNLDDFEPQNVAKQVEPLRKLLELRKSLANLKSSLQGNDRLESLLQEAIQNTEKLQQLGSEVGLAAPGRSPEGPVEEG